MPAESGRGRAQHSRMLGRDTDKENTRTTRNPTPPSPCGDQREPHLPRLDPAPLPSGAGFKTRHPTRSRKSNRCDALLARQERGAVVAYLATTQRPGERCPRKGTNFRRLRACSYRQKEKFPLKKTKSGSVRKKKNWAATHGATAQHWGGDV